MCAFVRFILVVTFFSVVDYLMSLAWMILVSFCWSIQALWLSALEHQMELKRNPHIGTVSSSKRIVHEVSFVDILLAPLMEEEAVMIQVYTKLKMVYRIGRSGF